jgi:hypothetical protein
MTDIKTLPSESPVAADRPAISQINYTDGASRSRLRKGAECNTIGVVARSGDGGAAACG